MTALVLPAHMGDLHAYEQLLVWLLAFGPFVVLFAVVFVVRRRDAAAEDDTAAAAEPERRADEPVSG